MIPTKQMLPQESFPLLSIIQREKKTHLEVKCSYYFSRIYLICNQVPSYSITKGSNYVKICEVLSLLNLQLKTLYNFSITYEDWRPPPGFEPGLQAPQAYTILSWMSVRYQITRLGIKPLRYGGHTIFSSYVESFKDFFRYVVFLYSVEQKFICFGRLARNNE